MNKYFKVLCKSSSTQDIGINQTKLRKSLNLPLRKESKLAPIASCETMDCESNLDVHEEEEKPNVISTEVLKNKKLHRELLKQNNVATLENSGYKNSQDVNNEDKNNSVSFDMDLYSNSSSASSQSSLVNVSSTFSI